MALLDEGATILPMPSMPPPAPPATWCNKDPCGMICAGFTYILIAMAWVGFVINLDYTAHDAASFAMFNFLVGMAIWSHLKTMLTEPGVVPIIPKNVSIPVIRKHKPEMIDGELVTTCTKCHTFKPYRAHHCSICNRCVRMMDHHCPWVNNCVGENNHKYFILFVAYIFVASLFMLCFAASRLMGCQHLRLKTRGCEARKGRQDPFDSLKMIGLLLESLVFGLFTLVMFCDQMCGVLNDQTTIEKLQHKGRAAKSRVSCVSNCKHIFGRHTWRWFFPIPPRSRMFDETQMSLFPV
eukprot:m.489293 g.489293  ORF g.489293 m.489293 type:complete len:295 (+) comp26588_c0_seq1:283-1167(+)